MFNLSKTCFDENKIQVDTGILLWYKVKNVVESLEAIICASPTQPTARVHSTEQASSRLGG